MYVKYSVGMHLEQSGTTKEMRDAWNCVIIYLLMVLTGPLVRLVMERGWTSFTEENGTLSPTSFLRRFGFFQSEHLTLLSDVAGDVDRCIKTDYIQWLHCNIFIYGRIIQFTLWRLNIFDHWAHSIGPQSCNLPFIICKWLSLPRFPTRSKKKW